MVTHALGLLFGFNGRIDRKHYWLGLVGLYVTAPLIFVACFALSWMTLAGNNADQNTGAVMLAFIGLAFLFVALGALVMFCTMALVAKRLHDINLTGYFCLAIAMTPSPLGTLSMFSAMSIVGERAPWYAPGYVFMALSVAVFIGIIALGFIPGQSGPNQYNHPPAPKPLEPLPAAPIAQYVAQPAASVSFGRRR